MVFRCISSMVLLQFMRMTEASVPSPIVLQDFPAKILVNLVCVCSSPCPVFVPVFARLRNYNVTDEGNIDFTYFKNNSHSKPGK